MEIPAYPQTRPIDISDKPLLDTLFRKLQPRVSELTFAGLYLFRVAHGYSLTRLEDALVVLGRGYDGLEYFLPPLNGNVTRALEQLLSSGMELYGADEPFVARYLKGGGLEIVEDRNSFDYLYLRDELSVLPGHRFHKKKNRISYFARRHAYRTELFGRAHGDGCRELLELWRQMAETEQNRSLGLEVAAAAEALELVEKLELSGVVVIVEERVRAFALGELLNRETAVCHFEKADPFMEGLSQVVNQAFAERLFGACRFVNREQDLGEAGLRNAKLSYHPLELVKKFRVRQCARP